MTQLRDVRPKHYISSSQPRKSLVFVTSAERDAFETDHDAVIAKHRALIRQQHGIWASNQSKFVATEEELNPWDSRDYL